MQNSFLLFYARISSPIDIDRQSYERILHFYYIVSQVQVEESQVLDLRFFSST